MTANTTPDTPEKVPADRSAATASTWLNPAVKAARSVRSRVVVNGVEYRSVLAAFETLGLPVSRHSPFRKTLKTSPTGKASFQVEGAKPGTVVDYLFSLAPASEKAAAE